MQNANDKFSPSHEQRREGNELDCKARDHFVQSADGIGTIAVDGKKSSTNVVNNINGSDILSFVPHEIRSFQIIHFLFSCQRPLGYAYLRRAKALKSGTLDREIWIDQGPGNV